MLSYKGGAGIEAAAKRMSSTELGFITSFVRVEIVAELYCENNVDAMRRINNLAIIRFLLAGAE